ncbi:MAG TPA: ABC transporter permease [Bryobacteraceae bacterium]|nr:ABC transporter permease [Bryobacteraceae bacterium]
MEVRAASAHRGIGVWVTAREAFWIAMEALRSHKLRSFLTLLGVVIATTTLIVVMSIVNGMNLYIAEHIANLGTNTFVLHQFKWAQGFDSYLQARRRNQPIRIEDYEYLRENLQGYAAISGLSVLAPNPRARYKNHLIEEITVNGVSPSHSDIGREKVETGRYLNDTDYQHNARVCVIGQDLVEKLFPNVDPIEKEVLINGLPFRVIGVMERVGSTFGQSQDNFAFVPLTTLRSTWVVRPELLVFIKAPDSPHMTELQDEVRALMRARRHVPYREEDTFGINASDTIMSAWKNLTGTIFAVTIGLVAVFMVVGGIVIMNIMLASVTERTHEIGIRKSLGARQRDILWQFVIESGTMSAMGGLAGVAIATGIARLVNIVFTASVPLSAIVAGLALSTGVGLFFGIYPARKAARLDPIEALRMES